MNQQQIERIVQQNFTTDRLFGVEFVPREPGRPQTADSNRPVVRPLPEPSTSTFTAAGMPSSGGNPTSGSAGSVKDKQAALDALRTRHDAECPHCTRATGHTKTVFGEGNPNAELMFIGEAPGAEEDRTGRPFVGRAGQKLDEIITAMGLAREQVYIANTLKSRPPDNRTPLQHEVDQCSPYLFEQIRIIEPAVIVTLGGPATKLTLDTKQGITRLRGVWSQFIEPMSRRAIPVMPTFHPAYLLRSYTPKNRRNVWSDMQAVMTQLGLT